MSKRKKWKFSLEFARVIKVGKNIACHHYHQYRLPTDDNLKKMSDELKKHRKHHQFV